MPGLVYQPGNAEATLSIDLWIPFRDLGMKIQAAFLTLCVLGHDLGAQSTVRDRRLWFGVGYGLGHLSVSCQACPFEHAGLAAQVMLRAGVTISPHFVVGVDFDRITSQRNTDAASSFRLSTSYYPAAGRGFFLRAGLGTSFFDSNDPHSPDAEYKGMGAAIAVGYDLPATRTISLTPSLGMFHGRLNNVGPGKGNQTAIGINIGFTFH